MKLELVNESIIHDSQELYRNYLEFDVETQKAEYDEKIPQNTNQLSNFGPNRDFTFIFDGFIDNRMQVWYFFIEAERER